jgi:hypothetical protein
MASGMDDTYGSIQWSMIILHDCFKRCFDSMKKHLASPPTTDAELKNLIGYCWAWADIINHHNDTEELLFFPWASKKIDFSKEQKQHEVIHAKIDEITAYLNAGLADPKTFDVAAFSAMLDDIKEPLYTHLDEEVEDLAAEKMKVFTEKEIDDFNLSIQEHIKKNDDPSMGLCFLKCHMPADIKETYPPNLPWFIRKLLVPYVFGWKHAGCVPP